MNFFFLEVCWCSPSPNSSHTHMHSRSNWHCIKYACINILHLYTMPVYFICILCQYTSSVYYTRILSQYTMPVSSSVYYASILYLYTTPVYYPSVLSQYTNATYIACCAGGFKRELCSHQRHEHVPQCERRLVNCFNQNLIGKNVCKVTCMPAT